MDIAIVGAGPAGLMAAWAVLERGHVPHVFDREPLGTIERLREGSINAGVFLLHEPCGLMPLRGRERLVQYDVLGRDVMAQRIKREGNGKESFEAVALDRANAALAELYRQKVYGGTEVESVSFEDYDGLRTEWDGHAALQLLIDLVRPYVVEEPLSIRGLSQLEQLSSRYDGAVSTVPLPAYYAYHAGPDGVLPSVWKRAEVWVKNSTAPDHEGYVWYAPHPAIPWYRCAAAFGRFTMELPAVVNADVVDLDQFRKLQKPIRPPDSVASEVADMESTRPVLFAGRYGRWTKGIEQHDVYHAVGNWVERISA